MPVTIRGTWPGALTLRSGWNKANARPWNDDTPMAMIRVVRGSSPFLRAATDELIASCREHPKAPIEAVVSPPLPPTGLRIWTEAGYDRWLDLDLYTRDLAAPVGEPRHVVETGTKEDWPRAIDIDRRSFDDLWRLGPLGLDEAKQATPKNTFLVHRSDGEMVGFAIAGAGSTVSYLQRVAVDPAHQGHGYGRSLVRAALQWGRANGAKTMLLNTQPENQVAARLYLTTGFHRLPGGLRIVQRSAG